MYGFIVIVNESVSQPNKSWLDQRREFYNNLIEKWLDDNDILMHSTHNEGKSVILKRIISSLKAKIHNNWQLMILTLILYV